MAAKYCWSRCCRVSVRPRSSTAPVQARCERGGERVGGSVVVETGARSGRLGDDRGYIRHPDRRFAALVDVAGCHLLGRITRRDVPVPGCRDLPAIAEASDLYAADYGVCPD